MKANHRQAPRGSKLAMQIDATYNLLVQAAMIVAWQNCRMGHD